MTPATKSEFAKITECYIRIQYLEQQIKDLQEALQRQKESETQTQRYISNRRLMIYIAIASITGGTLVKLLELVWQKLTLG